MGRPGKLTPHQIEHARTLISSEQETRTGAAALLNVDVKTLRRDSPVLKSTSQHVSRSCFWVRTKATA
jgi:hypothetical protein